MTVRRRLGSAFVVAGGIVAVALAATAPAADDLPATAGPVRDVSRTGATLTGTIGPAGDHAEGRDVTYRFEYGPNRRYSRATPTEDAGPANSPVEVQAPITGLKPATEYHWRFTVTFGIWTVSRYGRIFTTKRGSTPATPHPNPPPAGLSPVPVPVPPSRQSWLTSVACPSSTQCLAVGGRLRGRSYRSLAEKWIRGAWQVVPTPRQANGVALERLACSGPRSCLAVGGDVVERWNGRRWRRAPGPGGSSVYLAAIDCSSRHDCWASGEVNGGTSQEAAIFARWNGRSWSIRRAPVGSETILESVSCLSARDCWSAGTKVLSRVHQPWIAYHWDGRNWRRAKLPSSGRYVGELAVSCRQASACWAFGSDSRAEPVALRLRGGRWRRVPTALPALERPEHRIGSRIRGAFQGISCVSKRDCWAVGAVTIDNDVNKALVEHWTGGSWTVASAGYPIPISPPKRVGSGYARTQLSSIACRASGACVAVGETTFENRRYLIVRGKPLSETNRLSRR